MKILHFSMMINAPKQKVWHLMLGKDTYRKWTAAFMKGAHYEGTWQKGERITFMGPDTSGMSAAITDNRPHEFIALKHIEPIVDSIENASPKNPKDLVFGRENYTFLEKNGRTELHVDLEIPPEYEDQMKEIWPKALAKLKEMCETHTHGEDHSNMGALRNNIVV